LLPDAPVPDGRTVLLNPEASKHRGDPWAQVASSSFIPVTNPLERLRKEIKRRTNVVGIFPNRASLVRMVATLLLEQDDEWQVAERRYFSAGSMIHIDQLGGETPRELLEAIA
jgi:transposase-like protein